MNKFIFLFVFSILLSGCSLFAPESQKIEPSPSVQKQEQADDTSAADPIPIQNTQDNIADDVPTLPPEETNDNDSVGPKEYADLDIEVKSSQKYECPLNPLITLEGLVEPGTEVRLLADGFQPNSIVDIRMSNFGETYKGTIGTTNVDDMGNVDYTFTMPNDFPSEEGASIGVNGKSASGADRAVSELFALLFVDSISDYLDKDVDNDTILDVCDNCLEDGNSSQLNSDGDFAGDACDKCPFDAANDVDGDGLCADVDPCELDPDNDLDGDGLCAGDDRDIDGDGILNVHETNTGVYVSETNTGTDRNNPDTDGDGFDDGTEVTSGNNPLGQ